MYCLTCVWERSRAASTSSRMYRGAGLNRSKERMRDRATSDLREYSSSGRDILIKVQYSYSKTSCAFVAHLRTYLWPPLSSVRVSFHTPLKATLTSNPSSTV